MTDAQVRAWNRKRRKRKLLLPFTWLYYKFRNLFRKQMTAQEIHDKFIEVLKDVDTSPKPTAEEFNKLLNKAQEEFIDNHFKTK